MGANCGSDSCSCSRIENGVAVQPQQLAVSSLGSSGFPPQGPEKINTWYFDVLSLEDEQIPKVATWLLSNQRGDDDSSVDARKLHVFALSVSRGYLALPYHNVRHGVDVLQNVWRMGGLMPWSLAYNQHQQFSLMVAAVAHDIGHFGLTNVFLVDMRDELAVRYNDLSPLENMHCNKLFHILASDKTSILSHFPTEDFASCRKLMIDAILNTDPAQHGAMVQDLTALYSGKISNLQEAGTFGDELLTELFSTADVKTLGARCLLHAADLSNPSRPWNIARSWAENVLNEFFAQGDKEKELGIPVGMLNDRAKVNMPNSQIGFIQFMVAPFVSAYTKVFTKWFDLNTMLANNVGEWARLALEETGKDESGRVDSIRGVLDLARSALEIKDKAKDKEVEIEAMEDSFDEGALQSFGSTVALRASLKATEQQDVIAAREVRRWREQQQDSASNPETRQYRELLLIYMLSNAELGSDRDVVLKFSTSKGHFNNQREGGEARPSVLSIESQKSLPLSPKPPVFLSEASDPLNDSAQDLCLAVPRVPRVVSVAESVDNVQNQLTQEEFDRLLTSLLDNKDNKDILA